MQYFRSICSSLILFLISIILVANQGPTASGFETQGAVGPSAFDLGLPIHEGITRDGLYFLKSDSLESIVSQHVKIEQDPSSPNHFDNCQFSETVSRINLRYDAAIRALNPTAANLPQAEEDFGYILHAAQDFYAHTNWVEMGRTDLIDPWLGHWKQLNGYTESSNTPPVFILEEDGKPHSDFQIHTSWQKIIDVSNPAWNSAKMGLISGTYDTDVSKCPTSASIPHGGRVSAVMNRFAPDESRDVPGELNKDNPAIKGYLKARTLAVQQTTHEFCRLVDLARVAYGDAGVKFINDHWVQDQYLIDSPANNSRCPISDSTQVGLLQDSPIVEEKISSIPSWVKHNAQYWSDGSLTDKDFATGIGYLIQHKIISANVTTNKDGTILVNDNLSIPKWIKNNAKYWSEGSISDSDFKSGIEFMVNQKIISFSEPSILSQIEPNAGTPDKISLQSKHGTYQAVGDSDTYTVNGVWVLKSQNGIEHKTARYHIFSSTYTNYNIQNDVTIEEGVIQVSTSMLTPLPPGTWFMELLKIDGSLSPPDDSTITIVIPPKSSFSEPSILSQIEPNAGTPDKISLQSKHGTYQAVGDSDTYTVNGVWVLKSQNGIEHKTARYHIFSSTYTNYNIQNDVTIEEGVIQVSTSMLTPLPPGTWFMELLKIDGSLSPPDDSTITIVIPPKSSSSETPSTVQTTPSIPNTPLTQNTMDFSVPPQIVQEATSSTGAIVHFEISTSSPGGNTGLVICVPSGDSQFPLGSTIVTCTATDVSSQKTLKKSFTVIVRDTTPPAISPFNPHNDTPDDSGAVVYFTTEAIDLVDGPVLIHCDHQSGTKFPMGDTIVTCTADDSKGNHASRAFKISIIKS